MTWINFYAVKRFGKLFSFFAQRIGEKENLFFFVGSVCIITKMPTIEIAGLCLPLKPQKEKVLIFFIVLFSCYVNCPETGILFHYTSQLELVIYHGWAHTGLP